MSQNQRSTSDSECADFGRMASESIFVTTRVIALSFSFGEKSCTSGVTRNIKQQHYHHTIIHHTPCHGRLSIIIYNMGFLHLFIVNKAGGLILHRPLGPAAPKIDTNEWLRIGSTFHSLHAIAAEASPVKLPGNKNSCKHIIRFDM